MIVNMESVMAESEEKVFVTELQVFNYIYNVSKFQKKELKYSKCEEEFSNKFSIERTQEWQNFFLRCWSAYHRCKKKFKKKNTATWLEQASTKRICMTKSSDEVAATKKRKSFDELGDKMKKERTGDVLNHLKEVAKKDFPELNVTQLMGYLIHRENYKCNKEIAQVGHDLFTGSCSATRKFEVDEAIALMHSMTLSKEQMRKIKQILACKGVWFPTTNELLEGRKKLRPAITSVCNGKGVNVDYTNLVEKLWNQ